MTHVSRTQVLNVAEGEQPEGEGELAPMISMLSGPIDVSLQHTSFADSSLASNPIVVDVKTAGDEVLPIAAVLEPVQLLVGDDDGDDLDSYLDALATDTEQRIRQASNDEALIDWLLES